MAWSHCALPCCESRRIQRGTCTKGTVGTYQRAVLWFVMPNEKFGDVSLEVLVLHYCTLHYHVERSPWATNCVISHKTHHLKTQTCPLRLQRSLVSELLFLREKINEDIDDYGVLKYSQIGPLITSVISGVECSSSTQSYISRLHHLSCSAWDGCES